MKTIIMMMLITSCAPTVTLIGRETIMEKESSGDWPKMTDVRSRQNFQKGPLALKSKKENLSQVDVLQSKMTDH